MYYSLFPVFPYKFYLQVSDFSIWDEWKQTIVRNLTSFPNVSENQDYLTVQALFHQ